MANYYNESAPIHENSEMSDEYVYKMLFQDLIHITDIEDLKKIFQLSKHKIKQNETTLDLKGDTYYRYSAYIEIK